MHALHEIRVIGPRQLLAAGRVYPCTIGRNGMVDAAAKREGDLMTPRGTYPLRHCYYRPDRVAMPETLLPRKALSMSDGWCDDPDHPRYNQPVTLPFDGRHESLWRADHCYDLVIPLGYNDRPVVAGAGSAIFLHLMRQDGVGTEGCVAMQREDLLALLPRVTAQTVMVIGG